ncbi:MAG: MMPL family transporter, partial [Pirellulales bacterium]
MISTDAFAAVFARHRILVAAFVVFMTALASWGYFREKTPDSLLRGRREEQSDDRLLREVNEQFELRTSECFLVVDAEDLFSPQAVTAVRGIVRDVEALDYVRQVFWLDNLPVVNAFGLPEPILPREGDAPGSFQQARQRALAHPLVAGQLVSPNGQTLLMPVTIDWLYWTDDADCSSRLRQTAKDAAAGHPQANVQVRLTGSMPIFIAQADAFRRNDRKFTIISYALTGIIAIVLFRGLSAVLIVASAPMLAVFWSSGLIRLLEINRNDLTNAILPVLITMVGMTDGIHLMVYVRRIRAEGRSPLEAACESIRRVGLACLLTSVTTAIGFCSLLL